ncbi:aromatic acid/H+ symport family MFS transporter [Nocardia sp. CA2R105]|uniref:MFS transporter n=1 Tax=Nocardia coffeae TaxID=2873381 RepID=UPI001CA62EBB|nr:aromatic acid/H+ symport family MFS transporter [Nocardia coffeae]MBY8856896.1 aromatic acid/H+ symport family MFS transporter [Nocardia coffeae]
MELTAPRARSGLFVVALCFLTIVADGYDLIVYGATVPNLLDEPHWHMTAATAGSIGSWTLVGLMVGFLLAGPMTDRIGRRKVMMMGILWFSVGSAICALAQSPEFLGAARFATGIGLGGVVPSAVALTVEYAPRTRRQIYNGLTLTGYSLGGIIAALAALALLPDHSWRLLYAFAALYLLILPVMYFSLPESVNYLILRGRTDDARRVASRYSLDFDAASREHAVQPAKAVADGAGTRGYRLLLSRRYVGAAALFVITCFCSQLIVYGLNTWLPQLMRKAGYPLGSSLQFLLVLQLGAVVGTLGGSLLADRFGSKRVIVAAFLVGGVSLLALSRPLDVGFLMIAVAGAGLGTVGTSSLTYGYVATHFPASCRGSAVGAAMGLARAGAILGPLIGGWIAGSALGVEWNFYAFALPAFVAAAVASLISRSKPVSDSAGPEEIPGGVALPEPIN